MSEESALKARQEFYAAIAKVQAELGGAKKDSTNPHFKNRYADLESVWLAWVSAGPKHGFGIIQKVQDAGDRNGVIINTVLTHCGGHSEEARTFVPAPKGDAQGYGSAITYGRRYSLAAMVGIVQTDDDGEAARTASVPDVRALKSFADAAFKDGSVSELESILRNPAAQTSERLVQYVSSLIAKLQSKE